MSRYGGDCCHYDDGYDDGYADGQKEAEENGAILRERAALAWALRFLARRADLGLAGDRADVLRDVAAGVEIDQGIEEAMGRQRKREEEPMATPLREQVAA